MSSPEQNAPPSLGPVALEYCPCECDPLEVVTWCRLKRASGAADPEDQIDPAPQTAEAHANFAGAERGEWAQGLPVAYHWGHSSHTDYANDSTGSTSTYVERRNQGTDGLLSDGDGSKFVAFADSIYKFQTLLPANLNGVTVRFSWRVRTWGDRTATKTTIIDHGGTPSVSYGDEGASETWSETQTEDVTTTPGQLLVESSEHTLDVPPGMGTVLAVVGPAELRFVKPIFVWATVAKEAEKVGFPAYVQLPAGAGASGASAEPIYRREDASAEPGSGASYSGYQTLMADDSGGTVLDQAFSNAVPSGGPTSVAHDAPSVILPALVRDAVMLAPTALAWRSGLALALSDPDPTSRVTGLVHDFLAAHPLPAVPDAAVLGGQGEERAKGDGVTIAERFLPPSETFYRAKTGRYFPSVSLKVSAGISSLWLGDPDFIGSAPVSNGVDLSLTWERTTTPPSGAPGVNHPSWHINLTNLNTDDVASVPEVDFLPTASAVLTVTLDPDLHTEPAPDANARVDVGNLGFDTDKLDILEIGPQAEIVDD